MGWHLCYQATLLMMKITPPMVDCMWPRRSVNACLRAIALHFPSVMAVVNALGPCEPGMCAYGTVQSDSGFCWGRETAKPECPNTPAHC